MTGTNLKAARRRLPNWRGSEAFALETRGPDFAGMASRFDDGSLGGVFLQSHKADSPAGIVASEAIIAASVALQFGYPVETLCTAVCCDARVTATGPLGTALDMLAGEDESKVA